MATPKIRICEECGQPFTIPLGYRGGVWRFCERDHYRPCEICGKPVLIPRNKLSPGSQTHTTCSKECHKLLMTKLHSEGSKNSKKYKHVCEACGQEFYSSNINARVCSKDHYLTCPVCKNVFLASRQQLISRTKACSEECRAKLSHITYQERYNKETNPEAHAALIAKMESTMMNKYGVRNAFTSEGKELFDVKEKMIAKYGVDHPMKSEEIMSKRDNTNLNKYGSTSCLANPEIIAKSKQTCLEKYGVDNYAKSELFLKQVITEPEKASTCKEFRDDPVAFVKKYFGYHKPTLLEVSELCGIRDSSVGWILDQIGHPDIVSYTYSKMEDELYRFLRNLLGDNEQICRNSFQIITPYELDLYLPKYNFAIECNPTITHNSTIPGFGEDDEPKPVNYHKMKTNLCETKGIFLFHIFGYDWSHRSGIIKSMIKNVLGKSDNIIYARKTEIREVSDMDTMYFLNKFHRQGGAHSKVRLGLYYNNELVSVMTFSKMRTTIGTGSENLDNCYELVRFCSKTDTNVVGGASKLFKYFVKTYDPEQIRSLSDRAHTRGDMYAKLGFKYDHTTDPGYMWVDLKTDRGYARNNAQKANIKKFLNDDSIDLNKTEVQIMKEHNFVQVFDSGIKLWIWRKNNGIDLRSDAS